MPLSPLSLATTISTSLIASGMLGPATPQLALGVANGLVLWSQQQTVVTVDTGVLGAGTGMAPFFIPAPVLITSLLASYSANEMIGPMAPLEATGMGTGISLGLAQGMLQTVHPSVGVGAALGRIVGPPAFTPLVQGLSSAGMTGQGASKKASAISMALMMTLGSLVFPIPIVGVGLPSASGGVGAGKIL